VTDPRRPAALLSFQREHPDFASDAPGVRGRRDSSPQHVCRFVASEVVRAAVRLDLATALGSDDQQERPVVGGKWLLRHMDAEELSRASRYLGQGAQTCFRAAARLIAPPATHLSCAELEYEPVLVLARFLLAPASKRKSGTSWAGYRSGTKPSVSATRMACDHVAVGLRPQRERGSASWALSLLDRDPEAPVRVPATRPRLLGR
jgi:hypothetical protein